MNESSVNTNENLNRLDPFHIAAHLNEKPSRVLEPYEILVDVFPSNPPDPLMDARKQMIEPYLICLGFYYASKIKSFQYDNPLRKPGPPQAVPLPRGLSLQITHSVCGRWTSLWHI
ncbi:hypothetical protein PIB30_094734 [Stylosanthes scabra]|uniref:Uncharacterized protein n=1 Tax=Stylosanthes scabra TaxID=79078 RepID=A0ABU6RWC4_9FABA|nr:hypothetical protein [Stylosanthes scabra]